MKDRILRLAAALAVSLIAAMITCGPAHAWGRTGHDVIAEIAYQHLTPAANAAVDKILAADPRNRDLEQASNWPDTIRHSDIVPEADQHASRHFVDVPYQDGKLLPVAARAQYYADPETVTYGIVYYSDQLRRPDLTPEQRADYLSWVMHLVGDIHQPLHCTTRITDAHPAPRGDLGGNLFAIQVDGETSKLHWYWDDAPDRIAPGDTIAQLAAKLQADHPINSYSDSHSARPQDCTKWADESYDLEPQVYNLTEGQAVPDSYAKNCLAISSDRLAHAGYRLAAVLNRLFTR